MSNWTSEDAREFLGIIRNEASKVFRELSAQTSSICACLAVITNISESGDISVRLLSSPDDGSQDFVARNRSSSTLEVGDSVWLHYWGDYTNAYIAVRNLGDVTDEISATSLNAVSYGVEQTLDAAQKLRARSNIGAAETAIDNLTSTSTTAALSANQGKVLNEKIATEKSDLEGDKMGARELLWTNASPGSNFAAQTISLSLSGYEAIAVDFYPATTMVLLLEPTIIPVGTTRIVVYPYVYTVQKQVQVTTSGVVFGTGALYGTYGNSTLTTGSQYMIPYKIYGIKRLYTA